VSVRFGVIGTGFWAETRHAAGLAANPDVELVAVWGRDPSKAAAVADRHGATAFVDLDALFEQVDAVALAVPPDAQAELACRAAAAGCHLLLEKPIALSIEDAERIVAAVDAAGVATVVFFTLRYVEPVVNWLAAAVAAGEWEAASAVMLASSLSPDSPYSASAWRHERGGLWDASPHLLSLLLPALGAVADVVATRGRDDAVQLALSHRSGAVSSLAISMTAAGEGLGLELRGPAGRSAMPDLDGDTAPLLEAAHREAVSQLLAAIETGARPACDVRFGGEVVTVIAAAQRFLEREGADRGERP
jgi:predicted dehydrogenase